MRIATVILGLALLLAGGLPAVAQEAAGEGATGSVSDVIQDKAGEIGARMNQSPAVQEFSAGLLEPIYKLAEYMNLKWFHWAAFALMAAGVVSFALQLVLTKLYLLLQFKLNMGEILSDLLGLVISLVGLVLTTQAATENSTFTTTPALVVSSAAVGAVAGFIFYLWGQRTELRAARPDQKPVVISDRRPM